MALRMTLTATVLAVVLVVAVSLGWGRSPVPADVASELPANPVAPSVDDDDAMTRRLILAREGYASAPPEILALAEALFSDQELPAEALAMASPEALSAFYEAPLPEAGAQENAQAGTVVRRNLLLDAFAFNHLAAGEALALADADVNVGGHFLAFAAIAKMSQGDDPTTSTEVPFPDYSAGMPWLMLYAQHGGDLNGVRPEASFNLLKRAYALRNLEAILYLLEAGADGWRPIQQDDFAHRPFLDRITIGTSSILGSEMAFRVAVAGHFAGARPDDLDEAFSRIAQVLEDFGGTGPDARAVQWRARQVANAILSTTDTAPSERLRRLLAQPQGDTDVGWHLLASEVRSPPETEPGQLTDGTHRWTIEGLE